MVIQLAKAIAAPPATAASCRCRQPPSHRRRQSRDLRRMSLPSDLLPGRRGKRWGWRQFNPVVQLDLINCNGCNDNNNDDDDDAATTTMPSVAATLSFGGRSNNQQMTGGNEWGDYDDGNRRWRPTLFCLNTIVEEEDCNNNTAAPKDGLMQQSTNDGDEWVRRRCWWWQAMTTNCRRRQRWPGWERHNDGNDDNHEHPQTMGVGWTSVPASTWHIIKRWQPMGEEMDTMITTAEQQAPAPPPVEKSRIGGKQYLDYLWEPWWLSCYI